MKLWKAVAMLVVATPEFAGDLGLTWDTVTYNYPIHSTPGTPSTVKIIAGQLSVTWTLPPPLAPGNVGIN